MRKTVEITQNTGLIKSLLVDDYPTVTWDGCPPIEDFEPDFMSSIWFILYSGSEPAGLIKLHSLNWVTWIPHIVIKKEHRGLGSEQWGLQVVEKMKQIFKDVNFLILTPYESARDYAVRMGFKSKGVVPRSIKKDGQLMDQYILSGENL